MALVDIVRSLVEREVEFIVVGGLAAVLQGVPVNTLDIDVVYRRTPENIERLLSSLVDIGAIFRDDTRRIPPNHSHLESRGHKLLETRHGPLDLLGTIEDATGFEELVRDSEWLEIAGMRVRVITLERLVQVKRSLNRPKDRAMLMLIEATIAEKRRS